MPVAIDTHPVQGIDEFVVEFQPFWIGCHAGPYRRAVDIDLLRCNLRQDIPFREYTHQMIVLDHQDTAQVSPLHGVNGLTHGRAWCEPNGRLEGGQRPQRS